jgi:SAM-dependent methyltransferase
MLAIKKHYPNWPDRSIHESSPTNTGASLLLKKKCKGYIASQFFPGDPPGQTINGFINQDLEHQTFEDGSFDLVVTQDVFEHIFDPARAFTEICRTLKIGGAHIFSVPIINRFQATEKWAEKDENGRVRFLKTPEVHENPVDKNGSPVTMHWGFDIVDFIKNTTRMETVIEDVYDLKYGLSARYLEIFISRKKR